MKTHTVNHKFVIFTLVTILMVLGLQKPSYSQDLDVGEPRTVRMFYFLPNDRPYNADVVQRIKAEIRNIQTFYTEQMEAYGHRNKTFQFETDNRGEPMVHRVDGKHPERSYGHGLMLNEIAQIFDLDTNIYLVVLDNSRNSVDGAGGRGRSDGKNSGYALIPGRFHWTTAAHELGHAFGLEHDFRDNAFLMGYGQQHQLSHCAAEFLSVHPYFNPDIPVGSGGSQSTIELISPRVYPVASENIPVRLKVSDQDGLHQVFLFVKTRAPHFSVGAPELKACHKLAGEKEAIVEFDYDGVIPSDSSTNLSKPDGHLIYVRTIDKKGNIGDEGEFSLFETSTHRSIIPIEQRTGGVYSVAFSPDSSILAAALGDTLSIKLWNTITGEDIGTLFGHQSRVGSVAFSPDGSMLASGAWDGTVMLWDVATRTPIKTLKHTRSDWGRINSVAFSPDGSMLASGAGDDWSDPPEYTIKLWDVATRTNIATLRGHTLSVNSVAFSPDGTTLASGGSDAKIKLWDITTHIEITTFPPGRSTVQSVAFSPSGAMLASGGFGSTISLWDVATQTKIASLPGPTNIVRSVAFSPDGKILASGDLDGKILLWDVATQTEITSLNRHTSWLFSVAFSPDGTRFASGAGHSGNGDYTIILSDTSEFANLRLAALADLKITEIMVASNDNRLPQWIELYNRSETRAVNLKGWTLEIQNRPSPNFNGHVNTVLSFKEKGIAPQETLLIISKRGRASNHFGEEQIYNLNTLHPNLQDTVLSEEGFYLKLRNKAGELVDAVGNLDGKRNTNDKPAWPLPIGVTEDGTRTAMIRRYDRATARLGTEASGWIAAVDTKLATRTTTYYGHPTDIGAPGIESGGALPVSLSYFRAELTDAGIRIKWTTESELNNAGFNILRSETKNGEFKIVNSALIQGAGTTSERHTYTWTDTTAKPSVVYYYRIEDISYTGVRKQLATVRLRGLVSARGKLTTMWANLKVEN